MKLPPVLPPLAALVMTAVAALGAEPRILEGHAGSVLGVAFSPDGKTLVTCSRDKTIKFWDVSAGSLQQTLMDHTADVYSIAFSAKGDLLVSASGDKSVRLWDARTRQPIRTFTGHTDIVRSADFSPDTKTLASTGVDLTVRLWEVETGKPLRTLQGHTARVKTVHFSPDGKLLVSASSDCTARLWDPSTGEAKAVLQGHTGGGLEDIAWSPDGKLLASSGNDTTVRIWDVATAKALHVLQGHTAEVDSLAFSPDGKTIASGCKDKTIKFWDAHTGALLRTLTGHTGRVESITFSPDGKMLATGGGGGDTSVRLWGLERDPLNSRSRFPHTPLPYHPIMKLLPLVALSLLAAASLRAGEKQIFNGKDLTGWKGVPDFWSVQDGCLTGKTTTENMVKENTFLIWQDGEVDDFEFTCKFKLVDFNGEAKGFGNSGIQARSKVVKPEYFVVSGYQADMDTTNKYTGMLYEEKGRGILCLPGQKITITAAEKTVSDAKGKDFKIDVTGSSGAGDEIKGFIKAADWNEYKIIAKGNHLQHFVNGHQTADITDNDAAHAAKSGILALQLHKGPTGMTVQYKDMVLKTDN